MRFFIPIILLIVSAAAFFWFIDPAYKDIQGLKKEAGLFNEALNNSAKLQGIRESVREEFNAISLQDHEMLSKLLPDTVDNVRLVRDIDSIASSHGMTLRNVRVEVGEEGNTVGPSAKLYGTATVSFSVSAPYNSFVSFLKDLEKSLRLVDITNISFSASEKDLTEYQVSVRTYWLKK